MEIGPKNEEDRIKRRQTINNLGNKHLKGSSGSGRKKDINLSIKCIGTRLGLYSLNFLFSFYR